MYSTLSPSVKLNSSSPADSKSYNARAFPCFDETERPFIAGIGGAGGAGGGEAAAERIGGGGIALDEALRIGGGGGM